MEMAKGTKVTITTKDVPFLSQFDGQAATCSGDKGASGETMMFNLVVGSLYLTESQVKAA